VGSDEKAGSIVISVGLFPLRHRSFSLLRHRPRNTAAKWFRIPFKHTQSTPTTCGTHPSSQHSDSTALSWDFVPSRCLWFAFKRLRPLARCHCRTTAYQLTMSLLYLRLHTSRSTITAEGGPNGDAFALDEEAWGLGSGRARTLGGLSRPAMSLFGVRKGGGGGGGVLLQCHSPHASFHYAFHLQVVALRHCVRTTTLYVHNAYSHPPPSTSSRSYI
jgi:hypothetical protein